MKKIKLLIAALLFGLLLSCGGKSSKDSFFTIEEAADKPKVDNKTVVKRNWRVNLGGDVDQNDLALSPSLHGDYLYAASTSGHVYKVNAQDGKKIWSKKLDVSLTAGVGTGSGLVLVGTEKGFVYALNQENGSVAWQKQLSSEILASPVAEDDMVVARTIDGKVYGLAGYDGEIKWTISRQIPRLTLRGDSNPLILQGLVFAGFPDGTLAAVELQNGRALWDIPVSYARGTSEIDRLSDVDTTPLLVGDFIYVSSYQEVTHALNIKEQRIEWSTDISSFHTLGYDAAHLYITDKQDIVHQLDRFNGEKKWSQSGLKLRGVSAPIGIGAYVLVADSDGELYVLDKNNGQFLGRHGLGAKGIVGEAVVSQKSVYFIDTDGDLQSISVSQK